MLKTFHCIVGRQNIDDAQIIDDIHRMIGFVGSPQPAFILVEEEMPSIGRIDSRQFLYR